MQAERVITNYSETCRQSKGDECTVETSESKGLHVVHVLYIAFICQDS